MEDKFDGREEEVFEYLRDTCFGAYAAIEMFELPCSAEDVEEMMGNHNYEQCPHCGWWVEAFEMLPEDEDEPDGFCGNCRVQINE